MELETSTHQRVSALGEEGDAAAEAEQYDIALAKYREALELLPPPVGQWDAALWLLAAVGDAAYLKGDLEVARRALNDALAHFEAAPGNPFIRLRFGQCLYDLGDHAKAEDWLAGAFMLEGTRLFEDEDPKYLAFARAKLLPPPGGWPAGW